MLINDAYDSPVKIITDIRDNIEASMKDGCIKVIRRFGIDIDEEKLLQAIRQDHKRYSAAYREGYTDGYAKAKEEIMKGALIKYEENI